MRTKPHRRRLGLIVLMFTASVLALSQTAAAGSETVNISVLQLFHPTALVISPVTGDALIIEACGATFAVEGSEKVTVTLARGLLSLSNGEAKSACDRVTAASRTRGDLMLEVPGKLARRYRGILTLSVSQVQGARRSRQESTISAVVAMDLETAVASAVDAESPPGAPLAALEAQAIVARSFYLAAQRRHEGFDYCDTTHCQFLRDPPAPGAPASIATSNTHGMVLIHDGVIVRAYYSARCGGRTRALRTEEAGSDQYPYYSVDCAWCLRHPATGTAAVRNYGTASSHKLGLCQEGAADLARAGSEAYAILAHYYPNTTVVDSSALK